MEGWRVHLFAAAALIAVASPQHYRSYRSPDESARIYAAMAIVDHGTIYLDPVFDQLDPGWRASGRLPSVDVGRRGEHYLLDKAPGMTWLAVPVIGLTRAFGLRVGYAQTAWILALLFSAVPTCAFMIFFGRWLRRLFGADSPAQVTAAAVVLGSPWWIYAALFASHAMAAVLVAGGSVMALGSLWGNEELTVVRRRRRAYLGGMALGAAVLVEYGTALVVIVVAVALLIDRTRRARLPWVVLGGIGPATALAVWNSAGFGGPFEISCACAVSRDLVASHADGLCGLGAPSFAHLTGLLLSPQRGLLFMAPWLVVGLVGVVWLCFDKRVALSWRIAIVVCALGAPLLVSGFADWHGDRALGPRRILFVVPLWGVGAAYAVDQLRGVGKRAYFYAAVAGGVISASLVNAVGALGFPYGSERLTNPVFEAHVPAFLDGGPGATVWSALVPDVVGVALVLIAAFAAFAVALSSTGLRARGRTVGPTAAAAFVGFVHIAVGTAIQSPTQLRREILLEQAFVHRVLGHEDAAARALAAAERAPRGR